jgi:PAS domain S-box-containing protein
MVERVPEQNELHIRPAEERLAAVLNAVVEGVILTDDRGRIERMNSSAEDLTGWSAREALGKPLETVFPLLDPETRARVKGLLAEGPRKDSALGSTVPATLIARDRHETSIEYRIVPARSSSDSSSPKAIYSRVSASSSFSSSSRAATLSAWRISTAASCTSIPVPAALWVLIGSRIIAVSFSALMWQRNTATFTIRFSSLRCSERVMRKRR